MNYSANTFERLIMRMARPLVSLLIKNSVGHRRFGELIKDVYIDVAAREYGKGGRPTNVTRISLLTGIDRKQIKLIRERQQLDQVTAQKKIAAPAEAIANQSSQSTALGRVLSAWHQDADFSNQGQPQTLSIDVQFAALCKKYGGDTTNTSILNELLRVNAVEKLTHNRVVAVSRYYMPEQANPEALARSLDVYHDIGNTLRHNLYKKHSEASHFEGRASNPHVPIKRIVSFRKFVESEGQAFLEKIDARLTEYEQASPATEPTARIGLGLYWIQQESEDSR